VVDTEQDQEMLGRLEKLVGLEVPVAAAATEPQVLAIHQAHLLLKVIMAAIL
jgi:hypothetical protein